MTVLYIGYIKVSNRVTGDKFYLAQIDINGRRRTLRKKFRVAREAEGYGMNVCRKVSHDA